jgi:hypothetical protein
LQAQKAATPYCSLVENLKQPRPHKDKKQFCPFYKGGGSLAKQQSPATNNLERLMLQTPKKRQFHPTNAFHAPFSSTFEVAF